MNIERYLAGWDLLPEAMLVCDCSGKIIYWNTGCERVFGFASFEALGQSLDLIIPEKHRGVHWKGWASAVQQGHTRYGTELLSVPALRKDGARISIAFSIALLRQEDHVEGIMAVIRDDTARFLEIKELRSKLQEMGVA